MSSWDALVHQGRLMADVDICSLTTYRLGGPASWVAQPESTEELLAVIAEALERTLPILMLGRGSNVVVADAGYRGVVVHLGGTFKEVSFDQDGVATAGAAVPLPQLARAAAHAGLGRIEFYVGIPGSVGGAVAMNAGFLGGETADVVIDAAVVDLKSGSLSTRTNDELAFSYRTSSISSSDGVLSARFRLTEVDTGEALEEMKRVTRWRKTNQPGGTHNAGSVFKNPPGDYAGRLIDQSGLKGFSVGDVVVSDRHANFFIAGEQATSQDVFDLVCEVQLRVARATGVDLQPEIRFVGTFDRTTS